MSFKIETSQGNVALWDSKPESDGNYPTVVFIHGHCTNKSFFSKQTKSTLLSDYRLISLDLPGYGESSPPKDPEKVYSFTGFADIVAEIFTLMKLQNTAVVGWSLGGHVALELTSKVNSLKGIVITGTPPIEISAEGLSRGFRISDPKVLECFGKANLTEAEAQLLATISGYDYTDSKRYMVDAILETDEGAKTIYPQSILKGIGQNEVAIVRDWPQPIAVIAGVNDSGINNDYIINDVKFRNLWKERVHVIPNAGHAVQMEQPAVFNALLKDFFQDIFKK